MIETIDPQGLVLGYVTDPYGSLLALAKRLRAQADELRQHDSGPDVFDVVRDLDQLADKIEKRAQECATK
jgi:hypothetical protein